MSEASRTCPHCHTAMLPGSVRTTTRNAGFYNRGTVVGSNRVRWVGADGREFRVHAFRCDSCGYVELAATEPVEPPAPDGCLWGFLLVGGGFGAGVGLAVGWLFLA